MVDVEDHLSESVVLRESPAEANAKAVGWCTEQLLCQGSADVARVVTLFGASIIVLPMLDRVYGLDPGLSFLSTSHRSSTTPTAHNIQGVLDYGDIREKYGEADPRWLMEELFRQDDDLDAALDCISPQELRLQVVALQEWRSKALGRLRTLERRAAWAVLGMPVGSLGQGAVRRAFKRRALELHPDKGGDGERFHLLQEMRDVLLHEAHHIYKDRDLESNDRSGNDVKRKRSRKKKVKKDEKLDAVAEVEAASNSGLDSSTTDLSDSSYCADEEIRRIFTNAHRKCSPTNVTDGDIDARIGGRETDLETCKELRRRLHLCLHEMWDRAGRLCDVVQSSHIIECDGSDTLRPLRSFIQRFQVTELDHLKEGDLAKARRVFQCFLAEGAEVLCLAAVLNVSATVASVSMQVCQPLLCKVSSDDLKLQSCALLQALADLPTILKQLTAHLLLREAGTVADIQSTGGSDSTRDNGARSDQLLIVSDMIPSERSLNASAFASPIATNNADLVIVSESLRFDVTLAPEESVKKQASKTEVLGGEDDWFDNFFTERKAASVVVASCEAPRKAGDSTLLVASSSIGECELGRIRSGWDRAWSHSCAGERLSDGSAIFCHTCKALVFMGSAYNHIEFDLHCKKLGHYEWID